MQPVAALRHVAFEKNSFDGYLIFNPSNIIYFTGVPGTSALLIPSKGEGILYVYGVNYEQARAEAKNVRVELVKRGEDLITKIAAHSKEQGIKKLALDSLSAESWRNLAKHTRHSTRIKIKPGFVSKLREVKDEKEIALMRKAAELASLGMKTAYEFISTGIREYEVAAEIEYAMRKQGSYGTAFDTAVSSGPSSAYPHGGCTDRKIQQGELVVVDLGAVYKNYRSDMTRTIVVGKPSEKQMRLHAIVRDAQEKAFAAIKPKAKTREVDAVARKAIEEAGFGEQFVHGLGHGVGLDIHEPPTLNTASKERLQAGNVVTDEPGIYLPGCGGVRIEDTVLVTGAGAERLTTGPYGLGKE